MRQIKFGLYLPTGDFARARKVAERAEKQGFYSLSINDHLYSPMGERDPQLECFATLSAIAAITTRVRLAPAVVAMSFRNPALLAKTASTLDCISNGRLILGLGSGWQRTEYDAHGFPYPSPAERLDQLEDGINVLKAMWTQAEPAWQGRYFSVKNAYNNPRPVQKPYPPLMLGRLGQKAARDRGEARRHRAADSADLPRQGFGSGSGLGGQVYQAGPQAPDRRAEQPGQSGAARPRCDRTRLAGVRDDYPRSEQSRRPGKTQRRANGVSQRRGGAQLARAIAGNGG